MVAGAVLRQKMMHLCQSHTVVCSSSKKEVAEVSWCQNKEEDRSTSFVEAVLDEDRGNRSIHNRDRFSSSSNHPRYESNNAEGRMNSITSGTGKGRRGMLVVDAQAGMFGTPG